MLETEICGFVLAIWKIEDIMVNWCLLMYSNMYSIGIKIPTQNEGHLQLFDDIVRKYVKVVTVTDSMFSTWKNLD